MKRNNILKLTAIALFTLASCGTTPDTSSTEPVSVETSVAPASSAEEYPDVTLKFAQDSYEIERGDTAQIRVNITTTATTKTVNFTVEQDKTIIALPDQTEGVPGSIKVTAKYVGTATLIATSTVNPNVSARVTITVIKRIPALSKVWENMLSQHNYTINTYRAPSDTEMEENADYDEETKIPYSRVLATENAIINETAVLDEETGDYGWTNTYSYSEEAEGDLAGCALWGMGIDKNGYAFELVTDTEGNLKTAGDIVKTSAGLLTEDNFHGLGEDSSSPNDVSSFFGLEALNPNWLPEDKVTGNEYEIEGTEDDYNSCYAEYIVWGLLDNYGQYMTMYSQGLTQWYDIAALVDVTITATSSESVTMTLTEAGAMDDGSDLVLTAEITNIDTTTIDDITGLDTYLSTAEATMPALGSGLKAFVTAAEGNDYVYSMTYYFSQTSSATYYVYYTTEYVMCYYPADFCAAYNGYTGQSTFNANGEAYGYAKVANGIAAFEMDFTDANNPTVTVYDDDDEVVGDATYNIYDDIGYSMSVTGFPSYLNNTTLIAGDAIYACSDTAQEIFSGYGNWYYSSSANLVEAIGELFTTGSIIDSTVSSALAGIQVTYNGTDIDEVSFLCAVVDSSSTEGYYSLYYTPTYSHFGTASSQNPYDAAVRAAIAE